MNVELLLDGMIVMLLAATIGYCVVLNSRLARLRNGQAEFLALMENLTEATRRAQNSIIELRSLSETANAELTKNISAARTLADELSVMTTSGQNLADRLEGMLIGREAEKSDAAVEDLETVAVKDHEKDILKKLRRSR